MYLILVIHWCTRIKILCSLAKKHKLSKFKLKELEEICSEFEVEPVGTKLRKAPFINGSQLAKMKKSIPDMFLL